MAFFVTGRGLSPLSSGSFLSFSSSSYSSSVPLPPFFSRRLDQVLIGLPQPTPVTGGKLTRKHRSWMQLERFEVRNRTRWRKRRGGGGGGKERETTLRTRLGKQISIGQSSEFSFVRGDVHPVAVTMELIRAPWG